ncbi:Plasmid recombination enzyme [Bacillus subtilis subsp. subtilis]|nr:plasmid recombination protein [Bacillus subtilis]PLV35961.1 Plasmid recombination enzyme [Bacillus subtilis subsp. subtilis]
MVSEFLITASPDYMNGLSDEEQRRYFETAVDHLKEKYSAEIDLVRGEPSEKKHENVHQYKINQRQAELERLNAEIALKEKQREELEKQNKAVQAVIEVKKESLTAKAEELKIPTIEHEKAWLKKDKVILMANYAVIRMEKYKKDRLNGTQKHNR